jgi:pilus assembly protein CpaB
MGPARIIVLAVAAVAAIAAVVMMRALMGGQPEGVIVAESEQLPAARILTAGRDLAVGERLVPGDLVWTEWPAGAVAPSYIVETASPDAADTYAEAIVRSPMAAGEPFLPGKVVLAGDAGFMAAMLTPGMRAVSIPISVENGAGGFILPPDDRVDVLVTREVAPDQQNGPTAWATDTVLTNVRVLAIDQTSSADAGASTILGSSATLELTPQEAEILYQAYATGPISLSLRSIADAVRNNDDQRAAGLSRAPVRATVQVYRYGGVSRVAVQETPERSQ